LYFTFGAKYTQRAMNKAKIWGNIGLWAGLYVLWVVIFQNHALTISRTITVEFCYLLFIAANYYIHTYYSIPQFLYKKRYVPFALILLGCIVAAALLRVPLAMYINSHFFLVNLPQPGFKQLFLNSLVNIFVWVVCLVAAKLMIDKIRFQQYLDTVEKEKAKNELDFLKAQFNPHFLFNSINSIYGHIDKKNATARNMLLTFSEMLRYQLYECNAESISVDREVQYIKNYVALQQARKEDNLAVVLDIKENVTGFTIAPLLFIAFIENAFKYVGNNGDDKVEVLLEKQPGSLLFKTTNTKETNMNKSIMQGGIGISNVKRRLELLYPNKHNLYINDAARLYEVTLTLQLHEA
jgi:two-component system LytT family sensor kinase